MSNLLLEVLEACKEDGEKKVVITTNGYQIHGCISDFSEDALMIEGNDGYRKCVLLSAVSTIVSDREAPVF